MSTSPDMVIKSFTKEFDEGDIVGMMEYYLSFCKHRFEPINRMNKKSKNWFYYWNDDFNYDDWTVTINILKKEK